MTSHLWYASYGSNMLAARFLFYVRGGTPPGTTHRYPGFRDPTPPQQTTPAWLPGGVYFGLASRVWGGGLALYDPDLPGRAAARAYLITTAQFSDLVAQEMHRDPTNTINLDPVFQQGRFRIGPGRYETLVYTGDQDSYPVLTFASSRNAFDTEARSPAARYLQTLGLGLLETHGWTPDEAADYLIHLPGIELGWTRDAIITLLAPSPDA